MKLIEIYNDLYLKYSYYFYSYRNFTLWTWWLLVEKGTSPTKTRKLSVLESWSSYPNFLFCIQNKFADIADSQLLSSYILWYHHHFSHIRFSSYSQKEFWQHLYTTMRRAQTPIDKLEHEISCMTITFPILVSWSRVLLFRFFCCCAKLIVASKQLRSVETWNVFLMVNCSLLLSTCV